MSLLPRPRLTAAIVESAGRGVGLLVAAAGYGKTEAVRHAFPQAHYVALDPQSPLEVVSRNIIRAVVPRYVGALASMLQRPDTAENRRHLARWVADRLGAPSEPIVLEDFHHVNGDPEVISFVRRLVEATVPRVRWIITSREQTRLPIAAWITRGWMTFPLSEADLLFTGSEALGLAGALGTAIEPGAISELRADTLGWPIAMCLAFSAWERSHELPRTRLQTREMLHDYIAGEIWEGIAAADRSFLEAAALLPELRGDVLREAGFTNATGTLVRLSRRIPLVQSVDRDAFRLHDLFRDYIVEQLRRDENRFAALAQQVAEALARCGDQRDALRLYIDIGNAEHVIAILEESGFMLLEAGDRRLVGDAVQRLGHAYHKDGVVLAMLGMLYLTDGRPAMAEATLRRALRSPMSPESSLACTLILAALYLAQKPELAVSLLDGVLESASVPEVSVLKAKAIQSTALAAIGELERSRTLANTVEHSLPLLPGRDRLALYRQLGNAAFYMGDFGRARYLALLAIDGATELGLDRTAAFAYTTLLSALDAAGVAQSEFVRYAEEAIQSALRAGERLTQADTLKRLLVRASVAGDDELFLKCEERLTTFTGANLFHDVLPCEVARVSYVVGTQKNPSAGLRVLSRITRERLSDSERMVYDSITALLFVACDQRDQAYQAVTAMPVSTNSSVDYYSQWDFIIAKQFTALTQWLLGRSTTARQLLRSQNNSLISLFAKTVQPTFESLCGTVRETLTGDRLDQVLLPLNEAEFHGFARFIRVIVTAALRLDDASGSHAIRNLTRSEQEILALLPSSMTYKEIAALRGVSENTIKVQVAAIRSKLRAESRVAAVSIARKWGYVRDK